MKWIGNAVGRHLKLSTVGLSLTGVVIVWLYSKFMNSSSNKVNYIPPFNMQILQFTLLKASVIALIALGKICCKFFY